MKTHKLIEKFTEPDEKYLLHALGDDSPEKTPGLAENSEPVPLRESGKPPIKMIVPLIAAAAVIALAVPFIVGFIARVRLPTNNSAGAAGSVSDSFASESIADEEALGKAAEAAWKDEQARQREISKDVDYVPVKKTKDVKYGNLPQNLTGSLAGCLCPDTENDVLYFCNLSENETLCKLENGTVTEILPVTAMSINLWDGCLYYISNTEEPVGIPRYDTELYKNRFRLYYTGDIYRYNLATGETELLIKTDAFKLIVTEYGLDYTVMRHYENTSGFYTKQSYHADLDGGNSVETSSFPMTDDIVGAYYGEYKLEAADGAFVLRNLLTDETTPVLSRRRTVRSAAIVGDILYYAPMEDSENNRSEIWALDLTTGENKRISSRGYMSDFTVIGGKVYLSDMADFSLYDNGNSVRLPLHIDNQSDFEQEFTGLYTDGKNLYAASDRKGIYNIAEYKWGGVCHYKIGEEPPEDTRT